MAKICFEGAQATWSFILILVCYTRILLYKKMLKKKLKRRKAFWFLFKSSMTFQLEWSWLLAPLLLLGYANDEVGS